MGDGKTTAGWSKATQGDKAENGLRTEEEAARHAWRLHPKSRSVPRGDSSTGEAATEDTDDDYWINLRCIRVLYGLKLGDFCYFVFLYVQWGR